MRRILLWLWRVLPLSHGVQWPLLWLLNTKFLVGVMVVAFDDQERVLVVHHTYRNRYPWGLPGGWLGRGESPAEGALRELAEETGFVGEIGPLVWLGAGGRPEIDIAYLVRITSRSFRRSDEIDDYRFVRPDELPEGMLPFQVPVIAAARAALGQSSLAR
ncbi:MAG TPA: NUDIX hydrolase [Chloroflexota bacterium]|jgi:8-oxo-dGTP pyrophosphatase MutT (NUDIX family)|nr:NUDIX hydrolase [Chloroflexota bacterium]